MYEYNGSNTFENCLAFCNKVKYTSTLWPSNFFLGVYMREIKTNAEKNLPKDLHTNLIHNSRKWETIQTDKESAVYSYNGIMLLNKKDKLLT